jgi:protein-arginine kinase
MTSQRVVLFKTCRRDKPHKPATRLSLCVNLEVKCFNTTGFTKESENMLSGMKKSASSFSNLKYGFQRLLMPWKTIVEQEELIRKLYFELISVRMEWLKLQGEHLILMKTWKDHFQTINDPNLVREQTKELH